MIHSQRDGEVLVLVIDHPPVNALGGKVSEALDAALAAAEADPEVKAVVIGGAGKLFSGGADISEFGGPTPKKILPDVIARLDAATKPVVAAIHGSALGGGLELALACHYRVATPDARLGLPEVTLGLLPGAGGAQRLPRLIGVGPALSMIVSGDPIPGAAALKAGLVDRLADEADLIRVAIAFARTLDAPRRTRDLPVTAEPALFERFAAENARKLKGLEAPAACIAAIRTGVEDGFDAGSKKDLELFRQLARGPQAKALQHAFFAERKAARIDDLPLDTRLRPVARVGVIGAGTMGGGIAMNFLTAGLPVTLVETSQAALDRGVGVIRKTYETSAARGRLTTEQVERAMGLLTPTLDFDALAPCDLVVEAVYEDMVVKKQVFARLGEVAKPGAILASNTSFLNIDEIAAATSRPQDVLGLHFFSPANVMRLLEVVRGARTAPDVLATAMDLARRIKKVAVVSGVCHGFIGNRMMGPRQRQCDALLMAGASPEQIDRVLTDFGMAMGPYQMLDLAGLDVGGRRDPTRISTVREALCAAGRLGQKNQAGFYDYDEQRRPTPSPVAAQVIEDFRATSGVARRPVSDEEVLVRTLYAMVNEGAHILAEGIAQRASDIDVVYLCGYGWPRWTGGPMFWGQSLGLGAVVEGLSRYAQDMGRDFAISPLLIERAATGGRFDA